MAMVVIMALLINMAMLPLWKIKSQGSEREALGLLNTLFVRNCDGFKDHETHCVET